MPKQQHAKQIKNEDTYEALRDKGYSEEKAARISNAQANENQHPSKKGGKSKPYEKRSKEELYKEAKKLGIEGRSDMDKDELIKALRNH